MEEEIKAVETPSETAAVTQTDVVDEWEVKFKTLQAEKEKIEAEKENYRKGLLKAKGYLPNEYPDTGEVPADIEEVVKKVISETLLDEKSRSTSEQERKLTEQLIAENKRLNELNLSLSNRSQVSSVGSSSGGEKLEVKSSGFWTKEQEAELKKKGLDPEKVRTNFQKIRDGKIE